MRNNISLGKGYWNILKWRTFRNEKSFFLIRFKWSNWKWSHVLESSERKLSTYKQIAYTRTYLRIFKHLRRRTFLTRISLFFIHMTLHHRTLTCLDIVLNTPLYKIINLLINGRKTGSVPDGIAYYFYFSYPSSTCSTDRNTLIKGIKFSRNILFL